MQEFLKKPSTDFGAVRDGRQALPFYVDVDLTTARSIAAGTALKLDIAGNSFFTDADTTNGGNAVVHFQDVSLGNSSAPFFVSPGFIANVGFTQLLIENTAQVGKRMRIFYGVDIDFQAGVNASISISGTVNIGNTLATGGNVALTGQTYGGSYKSITNLAANTPELVFSAAANVAGAIIHAAQFADANNASAWTNGVFIAKATAPASVIDGDVICGPDYLYNSGTACFMAGSLKSPIKVPAGKGLYFITSNAETNTMRQCTYTLL